MLRDEQEGWTYRGIGDNDLYKILETYTFNIVMPQGGIAARGIQ